MLKEVIAVFDIGKTNKKFLLFNEELKVAHEEEVRFNEIPDDDGFPGDDISCLENWMQSCLSVALKSGLYRIRAVNFATYGATLMYIDSHGQRLTPVYNYLKPMPAGVLDDFYETYDGVEEFSRKTASPALGMLNSGLQVLWLKRTKPGVFSSVKYVMHLPQYLSYLFTRQITSEYTSIGCHTALWDFDNHRYHKWVSDEGIALPEPISNSTVFKVNIESQPVDFGIGIHDSSSSLVPYIKGSGQKFILISTGTWCIFMNPFNSEPLTADQLRKDALCYMSIRQQQVKSSRIFLGHIHDINVGNLSRHFGVAADYYKKVKTDNDIISSLFNTNSRKIFFCKGVPPDYIDAMADLAGFKTFDEAYHKFMFDLTDLSMDALKLIIPEDDQTEAVYISGGFSRNEIFVRLLACRLPGKKVYTSEIDNATALGAAMVLWEDTFGKNMPLIDLGLKKVHYEENS
jgi:sugar (pentulose or hexulose) kinase